MERMKRAVSLFLCFVMVIGMLPVSVFAADGTSATATSPVVVDAAVIFSDLHTNENDNKSGTLSGILQAIKNAGKNATSVTSAGDMFSANGSTYECSTETITPTIQSVFQNADVNYVWSDHDRAATEISKESGLVYGAGEDGAYGTDDDDNYYVYALSMADTSSWDRYNAGFYDGAQVTEHVEKFKTAAEKLDKSKPLFIVAHQPLLDNRGDNGRAYEWALAINEVAKKMDVAYFFGHNHKYDVAADYYCAKGKTMSVATTKVISGSGYSTDLEAIDMELNFTHMCAGYMAPASTNSTSKTTRQGVAMAITIYDDSINYTTYNASGVYTGNYALNKTVERAFAAKEEPVEIVEKKDEDTGVIVAAPGITGITVGTIATNSAVYTAVANVLKNSVGYDIKAAGYINGSKATVTLPIPAGVTNPAVYYVSDDAKTVEKMSVTKSADGTTVSFTTDHFSAYLIGEEEITEEQSNSVTIGGTTYEEKTVYVLVDEPVAGEKYLIANIAKTGNNIYGNKGNPKEVPGRVIVRNNTSVIYADVEVKEGTITTADTTYTDAKYIELDNTGAVWTVGSGLSFKNGNYYLNRNNSDLSLDNSASTSWTYSKDADRLTTGSSKIYYVYHTYYSDTWKLTESNKEKEDSTRDIFFYKQVTAQIPDDTQVTYTMQASNLDHILTEGTNTAKLSYALLANGTAESLPSGGSYKFEVFNDADKIISSISGDGTVTFSGNEGNCDVKVSYSWGENTVYKYVTVSAQKPFYKLEITAETDGTVITGTQTAKGDVAGTTRDYSAKLLLNGATESEIDLSKVVWSSSNSAIATVNTNGVVTFKGGEGTVQITATYDHGDAILTDTINIYVTKDVYVYPTDGTNDFPEYPNEGAIRFDKTAESVGTFSETGVAKLELSMTGVPYTTNNKMDVVLMLDRSSSMTDTRINATKAAVKVFIKNIVMNEDGSFNGNRIYVGDFLGGNPEFASQSEHAFKITNYTSNEEDGYQIVNDIDEYNALIAKVDSTFKRQNSSYGTEYAQSLEYCYDLLDATKADGNKQFCVFMSDGIPNVFQYGENSKYESTGDLAEMFTGTDYNTRSSKYHYEYHSTRMKANGVTVFSVGLGLENTNSAWSGVSAKACLNAASLMLNDISGPAGETEPDTGKALSKKDEYFFSVADANAAAGMENVFGSIAQKILEAATNVVVTDKVDDEYTMVFDIPQSQYDDHSEAVTEALKNEEFYIEFVEYALDANHERTTRTSKLKLYLGVTGNTYYAATAYRSTDGANKFADPVFTAKTGDQKAYWTVVDNTYDAKAGEIVIKVDSTTYKFIENGSGTHNMTAGAYAYGTIDATTNMSTDLVIVTPYFAYSAETRMLAWTVEKLTTVEYALNYFLYLDNSAADIGEDSQTPEGPYPTNDWAYITYTNFNGNDCRQEFPIPKLTWNGAQVSYVFYLVNSAGQPINKSGQVVDFANATFITDIFTEHVVWNDTETPTTSEGVAYLDARYKAASLLPSEYTLYDTSAYYELYVYEDHEGNPLDNYFKIDGSEANGSTSSTTKVYITKAGTKYSAYDTYTEEDVYTGFDFGNTTVAFAVVWNPALVPDTVVVDYGLDVLIDVVRNDLLQNTVHGIGTEKGSTEINSGVSTVLKYGSAPLTIAGNTISIEDENRIRFHQGDMEFKDPVTFYYDSAVSFYEKSEEKSGYLYSSVTVIPATTIYYEDDFLDYTGYTWNNEQNGWVENKEKEFWTHVDDGTYASNSGATQDQDRPGESKISADLDADNNYGYDSAYTECSKYSLGGAMKATVDYDNYAEASFKFYGTGFDVISLTSNATGTIYVDVYALDGSGNRVGDAKVNYIVDTYYGYTQDENGNWVVDSHNPNALYQVPVMQVENLDYGHYEAVIKALYEPSFDHVEGSVSGNYDFYLDAIRIYDPANDGAADGTIEDAYKADGEGWPIYKELRNLIIAANSFGSDVTVEKDDASATTEVNGVVFIDCNSAVGNAQISDYVNYGPNNELYLAPGQAVAFKIEDAFVNASGTEISPVDVQLGIKSVGGSASIEIFNPGIEVTTTEETTDGTTTTKTTTTATKENLISKTFDTATDMYYSIKALADGTIVISNPETSGTISITNLKFTFAEAASVKTVTTTNEETGENETSEASVASINEEGAVYSMRSLSAYSVTETVVTEPEVFEPETFKVSVKKGNVKVGQKVKVTVTTSDDVAYITVNGETVDSYKTDKKTGQRKWDVQIKADEVGEMTIEVVAYSNEDVASEPLTESVKVTAKKNNNRKDKGGR